MGLPDQIASNIRTKSLLVEQKGITETCDGSGLPI